MSSSRATSKDSVKTEERRSSPREKLKRHVVLVFFGEDNWGKLTNMSESGMAFEFAKPPSLSERVTFTFQAMGGMPMARNGKALSDSFEAPGKIVWTREFERGAGVQFVDLAEASREQIREWLSLATSANTQTPAEQVKPKVQPIRAALLASLEPGSNTPSAEEKKGTLVEWDIPTPLAEPVPERVPVLLGSRSAEEPYETPAWSDQVHTTEGPRGPESPEYSHASGARLTFLVVSGCLVAFAVTAGVRIFMARPGHLADVAVRASEAEVTPVSSPAASVASPSPVSRPPFQVDVRDANGRGWILWFVRGGAKGKDSQIPYRIAGSSNSSRQAMRTPTGQETALQEKPQAVHTFTMVTPNISHPPGTSATEDPSAEAPAIQPGLTPSSGDPFGGALGRQMTPAAPALRVPTGGMVQQPRLIRSAPVVYPQLAKSSRVSGDVVVDALIDAAGRVTAVEVISGPVSLQQAAVQTVRQWRYEPARLDGQAVAMHLTVTVKFRLN